MRRSAMFLGMLAMVLTQRASAQVGRPFHGRGLRWSIAGGLVAQTSVDNLVGQPADVGATVGLSVEQARGAGFGWVGALGFAYLGPTQSSTTFTPTTAMPEPSAQIVYGTLDVSWRPSVSFAGGTALLLGVGDYHNWQNAANSSGDAFGVNAGIAVPILPRLSLDASVHRILPRLGTIGWMYPVRLSLAF